MDSQLLRKIDGERLVEYRAVSTRLNVNDVERLNKFAKDFQSTPCGLIRAAVEAMLAELEGREQDANNAPEAGEGGKP